MSGKDMRCAPAVSRRVKTYIALTHLLQDSSGHTALPGLARATWASIVPFDGFVGVGTPRSIAPTDEFVGIWIPRGHNDYKAGFP